MELIEIGQIVNTHGIKGEIKLNPWTDDLYDIEELDALFFENGDELKLERARVHKNTVIIKIKDIDNINDAEKLKGKILFTEKTPLPEGRYYIKDLIGLTAVCGDAEIGTLTDVFNTGANDIYEIKTTQGKNLYLPVIEGVIGDVDLENKKIYVTIPEGLED